ncbi:MAG: hypothetical protein ACRD3W_26030, partial [Terriglobales bacterium]
MGQTLLSDAFDSDFDLILNRFIPSGIGGNANLIGIKVKEQESRTKIKNKIKSVGQECPTHT